MGVFRGGVFRGGVFHAWEFPGGIFLGERGWELTGRGLSCNHKIHRMNATYVTIFAINSIYLFLNSLLRNQSGILYWRGFSMMVITFSFSTKKYIDQTIDKESTTYKWENITLLFILFEFNFHLRNTQFVINYFYKIKFEGSFINHFTTTDHNL